jgi:hypothetical protein
VVPIPSVIPVFSVIPTFTPVDISVIRVCERGQNYSRNQRTCLATIERFFNITKALNKILLLFNANGTNKFITTLVNINGVVFKSRATTWTIGDRFDDLRQGCRAVAWGDPLWWGYYTKCFLLAVVVKLIDWINSLVNPRS